MSQEGRLAVVGARIVDAATGRDEVGTCVLDDGVIADVGPDVGVPAGADVIEAEGFALLPGLVDPHVHIPRAGRERTTAHEMLVRAGVTTAVEFADFRGVLAQWTASAAGLTVLGLQAVPPLVEPITDARARAEVEVALDAGAVGIKILGGHYPCSPEASAQLVAAADELGAYVAFHAGTTAHGSNLQGMEEAIALAEGRPFHLAHTNAYLRGAVDDPLAENLRALRLLREHPEIRSEAHLAPLNACFGGLVDGEPRDHIVRNCLALRGYPPVAEGMEKAFLDGYAHVHSETSRGIELVTGAAGLAAWRDSPDGGMLSFPVNLRLSAYLQTCARVGPAGGLAFEGPGDFVVDAICSDGGTWRNVIVDQGLTLVHLGALTLLDFVRKASWHPARMFGLQRKGTLSRGADADVALVDLERRQVRTTIAAGRVVYDGTTATGTGGTVLTTERGAGAVAAHGVPHRVLDPAPRCS
ncbi:MAG: amidohydrolase family protein [Streptosporangiales bacterium]